MGRYDSLDELARPLWAGRPQTEDELVRIYRPLVAKLASRAAERNGRVSFDEFEAAGLVAALDAIRRFDPDNAKGASGSTFIGWRVGYGLVEEVRERDVVKPKVRSAYHRGEIDLPAVMGLLPDDDCPVTEYADPAGPLAELLDRADPLTAGIARVLVEASMDADAVASRLGISPYLAGSVQRWVVARLQATPVLMN